MVKDITKKQAVYLLLICLIGTKFQRLPSFLSDVAGKGFWIVVFIYLLIDGLFLLLSLKIINLGNGTSLYNMIEKTTGKVFAKTIFVLFGIYFFMLSILPYESVHEVFADIIFDSLPWKFFALFLLIAMGVIAVSGLRNIGRLCQLLFYVILFGVVGLFSLGLFTSDISAVLPLSDIVYDSIFEAVHKSSLWFGNFTILFVFMGHIKDEENKKWGGIKLSFFISFIFVALSYVVFYGIYQHITPLKRNWLTKVSQFALLSLDIGRLDWFLILFAELATIITSGIFVYCSANCFREVFKCKKMNLIIYVILFILYLNTNYFVSGKLVIFKFLISYGAIFGAVIQYVIPIILLFIAISYNKKHVKTPLKKLKNPHKGKYNISQSGVKS